jgi:hypothetical protein
LELFDLGVLGIIAPKLNQFLTLEEHKDIFFSCLARIPTSGIEMSSATELFSAFVYCFLKSYHETEGLDCLDLMENPDITRFLREELGVFRIEASLLGRALELMPQLNNIDNYLRKGHRRQISYLANEVLPLAIRIAQLDYSLLGKNLYFWTNEFKKLKQ